MIATVVRITYSLPYCSSNTKNTERILPINKPQPVVSLCDPLSGYAKAPLRYVVRTLPILLACVKHTSGRNMFVCIWKDLFWSEQPLGRHKHRWKFVVTFRQVKYNNVQLTGQAECRIRYEHSAELSDSVKFLEPLSEMSHCQLFKQNRVLLS
jgi:hypothetical protein